MHLHQVGLHIESCLTRSGTTDDNHILFLAYFGCFGRLFMVRRSVSVRMTLFEKSGSVYGLMSSGSRSVQAVLFALPELLAVLALEIDRQLEKRTPDR